MPMTIKLFGSCQLLWCCYGILDLAGGTIHG